MCSEEEWKTIANVVEFLKIFKTATEVLSGSKYPTISLVLQFRELIAVLQNLPTDCTMVMSMKQRMRQALNHRLPVTELNIIASLRDPSQRNLTVVQDFLAAQETTAFRLLSQAIDKYTNIVQASNNSSGMNEAASISESAQSQRLQFHGKRQNKTCCQNMLILQVQVIKKFSCIDVCRLHLMMFWLGGNDKQMFIPAGLTVNAKRSSLAPSTVDKVVFIHENAHFVNESFE